MSLLALSLYKQLMREARTFPAYNFKMYALRRIKDAFKENRTLSNPEDISRQLEFGKENLAMLKRQAQIGRIYSTEKLVIEK